nr:hypothetical protein [Candidatus Sigynarchaeota archaeon]
MKKITLVTLILVLICSCWFMPRTSGKIMPLGQQLPPIPVGEPFGVTAYDQGNIYRGNASINCSFPALNDSAMDYVRVHVPWDAIEPQNDSFFSNTTQADALDSIVADCNVKGKKLLLNIAWDCAWASSRDIDAENRWHITPVYGAPLNVDDWKDFITHFIARYNGNSSFGVFEIYDAPNIQPLWISSNESVRSFARLCCITAETIRASLVDAVVVLPGLVCTREMFTAVDATGMRHPVKFIDVMLDEIELFIQESSTANDFYDLFDAVSFNVRGNVLDLEACMALLEDGLVPVGRAHGTNLVLWMTGFGFNSTDRYLDVQLQADSIAKVQIVSVARHIQKIMYGNVMDGFPLTIDQYSTASPGFSYGLVSSDFVVKPGFRAFETMATLLSGGKYAPGLLQMEGFFEVDFRVFVFIDSSGRVLLFFWNNLPGMVKSFKISMATADIIASIEEIAMDGSVRVTLSNTGDLYIDLTAGFGLSMLRITNSTIMDMIRIMNIMPEAAWVILYPLLIAIVLGVVVGLQQAPRQKNDARS